MVSFYLPSSLTSMECQLKIGNFVFFMKKNVNFIQLDLSPEPEELDPPPYGVIFGVYDMSDDIFEYHCQFLL